MDASSLCQRCGLCCDGTLFAWVVLGEEEAAGLRAKGAPVLLRQDGSQALRQACHALQGRCCTIYGQRPANCRKFRCNLLIAAEEGELSFEEAGRVVDQTHAAIGEVADAMGLTERLADVMVRARKKIAKGEERPPEVDRAWSKAEDLLSRYFRGR